MLRVKACELLKHVRWLNVARWGSVISIVCLVGGVFFRLVTPIEIPQPITDAAVSMSADLGAESVFDPNDGLGDQGTVLGAIRPGLFKSAAPVRDRPIADTAIERIRSQLSLGCILETEGELVAYIRVKDLGLKRCKTGDSVEDLFTVLDIQEKSVVISIIDHRVKLSL